MATLAEDVANLQALLITLINAANATEDMAIIAPVGSLSVLFGYVSQDPANMAQEEANGMGYLIRQAEAGAAANGDPDSIAAAQAWHTAAAQAFVDHYPDLDWDEVAGTSGNLSRSMAEMGAEEQPLSGVKHKPEPSA